MGTDAETAEAERKQLLFDVADICSASLWKDPQMIEARVAESRDVLLDYMADHSTETLRRLIAPGMTGSVHFAMLYTGVLYWDETPLNDYLHLRDAIKDERISRSDVQFFITPLKYYAELIEMTDGHYPEERASQVRAVFTVMRHAYMNPHDVPDVDFWKEIEIDGELDEIVYMKDEGLRELLLTSGYDRETLVNIITTRSIFDPKVLVELLESGPVSLSDGNL